MSLDITELDTVSYPSWWATSTTVRITVSGVGIVYEGATADVEFLPQGVAFPYSVVSWALVSEVKGLS